MSFNKNKLIYVPAAIGLFFLLYQKYHAIAGILSVFAYAVLFLLILSPLCSVFEKKGIPASISALLSLVSAVLIILMLFSILFPYLIQQTSILLKRIVPVTLDIVQHAVSLLNQADLYQQQEQSFQQLFARIIPGFSSFAARESLAAATYAGRIVFAFILAFYLLRDREMFVRYFLLCFPLRIRMPILQAALGCKNALLSHLCGVLKTGLFVSALMYVGLLFFRIENALLLALFMGILEVIPYFGPILGSVPIVLSVLPYGIKTTGLVLVFVVVVQQIENSFAGPYFTSTSTSVHPFYALVSVFVFGSLFGIWGIILAIPTLVSLRSLFWSYQKYKNSCTQ